MSTRADEPVLVVVCGLPGAGKTTVSEEAADRLDAALLRTDVVRKDVAPDPEYTDAERRRVYDELFDRASARLEAGESVVLDGTFTRTEYRERARSIAERVDVSFQLVRVECEEDVVRDRIAARENDESDADFEIYELYRDQFEAIESEHARIDNSASVTETYQQVADVL